MVTVTLLLLLASCSAELDEKRMDRDSPKYVSKLSKPKEKSEKFLELQVSSIRTEDSIESVQSPPQVIPLMDADEMGACRDNLSASDRNGDGEVSAAEFANFVSLQSGGAINVSFGDLGLAFIAVFFADVCTACYTQASDQNCCVGNSIGINFSSDDSVTYVCKEVGEELAEVLGPSAVVLCVDFAYTMKNAAGLSAEDIMKEVGNSIKDGLEVAGSSMVVSILDVAFPDGNASRNLEVGEDGAHHALERGLSDVSGVDSGKVLHPRHRLDSTSLHKVLREPHIEEPWHRSTHGHSRQLVFFDYDRPSEVIRVVDNPDCPDPGFVCATVEQNVCVTLEEGDDPTQVRDALRDGIWEAIDNGDFLTVFPSENLP